MTADYAYLIASAVIFLNIPVTTRAVHRGQHGEDRTWFLTGEVRAAVKAYRADDA